ncbi:hypothetical protein [Kitasatospora sp. NPDC001547]|uniref:hypothetical protein n=1 Tax=Kitasatospora sp. NPDC001547 TaxID=3364015 RepID=UPI0036A977D0
MSTGPVRPSRTGPALPLVTVLLAVLPAALLAALPAALPGLLPTAGPSGAAPLDVAGRALDPLRWYESPWFEAVATLLCLTGFAGFALTGAFRRRLRPGAPPRAARWAALAGTVAALGALGYLLFLVLTAAMSPGPVLFGRPVVWLAVQLLGLFALGAAAVAAAGARRERADPAATTADRVRLGALLLAGLVFLPWVLSWGLLP